MTKFRLYFILLAVGFILIAFDLDVRTDFEYPQQYKNSEDVIGEFQYYNISSNYGGKCTYKFIDTSASNNDKVKNTTLPDTTSVSSDTSHTQVIDKVFFDNIHIDIFNDFIGFLFILIACLGLRKCNKVFYFASAGAFCGIILHIILKALPFVLNGLLLCNISMAIGFSYLGSAILTTFLFSRGLFSMCSDVCCRDERKWGKIAWFVATVLQILTTFIFWAGSDFKALRTLGYVTEGFLVLDIILFWFILKRVYFYLEKSYINAISKRK